MKYIFTLTTLATILNADISSTTSFPVPTPPYDHTALEPPKPTLQFAKDPMTAAVLSGMLPGLGHAYLDDYRTAGLFWGATAAEVGGILAAQAADRLDIRNPLVTIMNNQWLYSSYAAYRDAHLQNGLVHYHYKMPMNSLAEVSAAAFNPKVLKKPEVWGGILGGLTLAAGLTYWVSNDGNEAGSLRLHAHPKTKILFPLSAFTIGIGEESYFRGFLMTELSERFGPKAGLVSSSILFGAAHLVNTIPMTKKETIQYCKFSIPYITLLGAYFGYLTQKNNSLEEAIAVHSWYDCALFSLGAFAGEAAISGGEGEVSFSIPF